MDNSNQIPDSIAAILGRQAGKTDGLGKSGASCPQKMHFT